MQVFIPALALEVITEKAGFVWSITNKEEKEVLLVPVLGSDGISLLVYVVILVVL